MNFIKATRQSWKLYLSIVGLGIFYFFRFFGDTLINKGILKEDTVTNLTVYSLALMFLIIIFMCVSIRCPKCHMSISWYAMSKLSFRKTDRWLQTFSKCPGCGYKPVTKVKRSLKRKSRGSNLHS